MSPASRKGHGRKGFEAFAARDFALYWWARMLSTLGIEMLTVTVGWQVYGLTGQALDLGLIGLAQFAPFGVLFLVTGMVADRFSRTKILTFCVSIQTFTAAAFLTMTAMGSARFDLIFSLLVLFGIARAFQSPVQQSIVPLLVQGHQFPNAIVWNNMGGKIARIVGPASGGLLIALGEDTGLGEALVYGHSTVLLLTALVLTLFIRKTAQVMSKEPVSVGSLLAGLSFIWSRKVILAATLMDLFAVLFGGAVALLPICAKDILMVGPEGFGLLRAALMGGAFTGGLVIARVPITRHAGAALLGAAGLFGLSVIVFGASTWFWLSMVALAVMGAADIVSVFVRHSLVQLVTPDEMRGRVGAAVGVMVGASNELGEFESGLTAHWWGTVPAVLVGGAITVSVAALCALTCPALRKVDSLDPDDLVRRYRAPHDRHGNPLAEP